MSNIIQKLPNPTIRDRYVYSAYMAKMGFSAFGNALKGLWKQL